MFDKTNKYVAEGVSLVIAVVVAIIAFGLIQSSVSLLTAIIVTGLWAVAALSLSRRYLFMRLFWTSTKPNNFDPFSDLVYKAIGFVFDIISPFVYLIGAVIVTIAVLFA